MSLRDGMVEATFRGKPFFVRSADSGEGRRTAKHEFPGRDKPYVEDLGAAGREFTLDCYVIGPRYMPARDALLAALHEPGPGPLNHPYRGELRVQVAAVRVRETTSEGGLARLTVTFQEAPDLAAAGLPDTVSALAGAAGDLADAAETDFSAIFDVLNQAEWVALAAEGAIGSALQGIEDAVAGVTGPIASIIRAPANIGAAIAGSINRVNALIAQPGAALGLYDSQSGAGDDPAAIPQNTPGRRQQAANQQAVNQLVRLCSLAGAALAASDALTVGLGGSPAPAKLDTDGLIADIVGDSGDPAVAQAALEIAGAFDNAPQTGPVGGGGFSGAEEAFGARDDLLAGLDGLMGDENVVTGAPIGDGVFAAAADLRAAVVKDFAARAGGLPPVSEYTPAAPLPALVIANSLYGEAARDADIIARNNIRHPLFVPGGEPLEVTIA